LSARASLGDAFAGLDAKTQKLFKAEGDFYVAA
jgi:hypothetical protein